MNKYMVSGVFLVLLGGIGLAIPVVTLQQTTDVASIGDLKLQAQEETSHPIPLWASGGALFLGLLLIGGGLYRGR